MYDVIIIGAGPAGISASLYAKRANKNVMVLYFGESNLEKAHKIDNYYGFPEGITGKDLFESGVLQAKTLGVEVKEEEVLGIEQELEGFDVTTKENKYNSKTVIIATGNKKLRPQIENVVELEGKGISYCAICDGFFYRKKNVVVIGNGDYAVSEAEDLKNVAASVKILTNGLEFLPDNNEFEIETRKIKKILGEGKVSGIEFEDGSTLDVDGVFVALGKAGGSDFAKKMGVVLEGDNIKVDEKGRTNIDGLFSCGDTTGGLLQVSKAVHEGAEAGLAAVEYLKKV